MTRSITLKHILIACLLLAMFMGNGAATLDSYCYGWGDGEGAYPVDVDVDLSYHSAFTYLSRNATTHPEGIPFFFRAYIHTSPDAYIISHGLTGSVSDPCGYHANDLNRITGTTRTGQSYYTFSGSSPGSGVFGVGYLIKSSGYWGHPRAPLTGAFVVSWTPFDTYLVSGNTSCVSNTSIGIHNGTEYIWVTSTTESTYSFEILDGYSYRLLLDEAYYDFTCEGEDITFDYGACIWVYGYSCGVDTIKLRDNNSQLIDTVAQASGYDIYEMQIEPGEEYTISFYDMGIILCYSQTFTCTGDHVLIDFDRCNWVYPPNGADIPIYLWAGYDYNVVLLKDNHGNLVENGKLAIYDETDDVYIQRWTDNAEGYALLGAMFPTDHDVRMMFRTFDGIFTLDTTYPANGTSLVGEEDIATTEWTIPIKYNIDIIPLDQYAVPLFDVFCGLSEYTPLDPQAFWGMDLSDRGYVPVTNCSGFAMCDIIAEKEGYADYSEIALNWTSKSAMIKDYRHNIVMEEE